MPGTFDAYQYLAYLRSRWRLVAIMTGTALAAALHLARETMRLNRLRELETPAGYRGELLQLLDPGVVPEKPSWPNLSLNLAAALALALLLSWLYLTLQFGLRR
jgi:uncharacterized protein involved in exopolysaccharide biosynthesis